MMLVRNANGEAQVAIILALTGAVMRVAVKDTDDVAEYKLVNQTWIDESFEPVTFEFPLGVFEAIGILPPGPGFTSWQ